MSTSKYYIDILYKLPQKTTESAVTLSVVAYILYYIVLSK